MAIGLKPTRMRRLISRSTTIISTKGDVMADDETITSKTITTARWLRLIKPILDDFAADRQVQEREWFSEHPKILSPTEMICRLEGFCFWSAVADPSSREVADLSE